MGRRKHKQIQHSSYDLSDATVLLLFLVVVVSIVFFYDEASSPEKSLQQGDPQMLLSKLVIDGNEASPVSLVVGNSVDSNVLNQISNTAYDQLKLKLGVKSDFVIYFEDQSGNLVMLGDRPCIGSSFALVNGHRCSE